MRFQSPTTRRLLAGTLLVPIAALGVLGYVVWKYPEAFRRPFQSWRGSEKVRVRISHLALRRVEDHAQLTVTGNFRQSTGGPLRLAPPLITLEATDADGGSPHQVEPFTGAFLEEPLLPPQPPGAPAPSLALHFWLPLQDLSGRLALTVDGDTFPLKNQPGFSVDSLPNGQTVGLSFPEGNILPGPTSS